MYITNSEFTNLVGNDGGALNIQATDLKIINTKFDGNQAAQGGALYLNSPDAAVITNNTFSNNYASVDGGAVLLGCLTFDCEVSVTENLFYKNEAVTKGGAL